MSRENWKKQTFWSLPIYTGDVSGVCSALYELGGMVVMHDPSGCNSTYNTHDEIRWMDMESLIFLSALRDIDAITGNDQKLIDDVAQAAEEFRPEFIAIANSPVPWLIGTDFRSICSKIKEKTGIPTFHVGTNAMHDYTVGAGDAFRALAEMLFSGKEDRKEKQGNARIRVNVLGMTPLDFTVRSQTEMLRHFLDEAGFDVISIWAVGDSLKALKRSTEADVNLVVSSVGLQTARYFEQEFGIPYVAGMPCGAFAEVLYEALRQSAGTGVNSVPYLDVLECFRDEEPDVICQDPAAYNNASGPLRRCYAGEPVTMGSLAAAQALADQRSCDIVCLTETNEGLIGDKDSRPEGEAEIRDVLKQYHEVTADPMYRHVCKRDAVFHELPHFACSGRLYLSRIPVLISDGEIT